MACGCTRHCAVCWRGFRFQIAMTVMLLPRMLLLLTAALLRPAAAAAAETRSASMLMQGGCASFLPNGANETTGIDYADANISVVRAAGRSPVCCAACTDWNRKRKKGDPACLFAVWHKDTSSCALKATGLHPKHGHHVAAVSPGPPPPPPPGAMKLIVLPNASSVDRGAKCLDGSPPAIYHREANTSADPSAATKFVLYFKGGGWCENATACALRSGGLIGSSNTLRKHQPTFSYTGVLDPNPATNPDFAHHHHIVLWYCDGGSFSGDRTEPVVVASGGRTPNQRIWYRGKRVLDAILDYLKVELAFGEATEVLLSGGSAGGLSVYLHADYVRAQFGPAVKFRAAPVRSSWLSGALLLFHLLLSSTYCCCCCMLLPCAVLYPTSRFPGLCNVFESYLAGQWFLSDAPHG